MKKHNYSKTKKIIIVFFWFMSQLTKDDHSISILCLCVFGLLAIHTKRTSTYSYILAYKILRPTTAMANFYLRLSKL